MTYDKALEKIHSLDKFGSRPGLDRISALFEMLGDDLLEQKFIHVAGTNGKGSTCQMISRVLTESGYKTGLFISPYITDFCERIQINNEMVKRDVLTDAVEHLCPML
ncbi:MAG: bifunctional folylpolyglutamate synthase/dihydrofolate synthase, partial [Ruminococcus sp.]|nr:bifunctional folylpolyglutamate synthase/dihydrofolate synthase [Ruminococcus sp.]